MPSKTNNNAKPVIRFARHWAHEIALGYHSLVNLGKGLPPPAAEPPQNDAGPVTAAISATPADQAGEVRTAATGNGITGAAPNQAQPVEIEEAADAGNEPEKALEQIKANPASLDNLAQLINCQRTLQKAYSTTVPLDDPEREAERQQKIQANLEAIAQRELAMQEYIQANAERAAARKAEIENEIRACASRLNQLDSERDKLIKQKQEQAAQQLQELTENIESVFNQIDHLEEERKFIKRGITARQAPNNVLLQELIQRQQKLRQQELDSSRNAERAEEIRKARELRIKTRAERLARLMSHRAEEIAAQKAALRQSKIKP